ncbi:MAG: FAD-dependent oxidoreductase [Gammaproteobacteria bacterium]|nr:FAD-dependent oxidoreductase [Gammaproteobacteria bacterium]
MSAARRLKDLGHEPVVFDKSRGLGGRMATRRTDRLQFDHGAQYFTARDAGFKAVVAEWMARGVVAEWSNGIFVGTPGMTAPARALADGIDVMPAVEVTSLESGERSWCLHAADGPVASPHNGRFPVLIVAVPAPQVIPLVRSAGLCADTFSGVRMAPCWALLLTSTRPLAIHGSYLRPQSTEIAWVARDSSKPTRRPEHHAYVVHATPEWSRETLELAPADVVVRLSAALSRVINEDIQPTFAVAHRWRYALVEQPLGRDFAWDNASGLGACGDWCIGARIEDAFLSGLKLADAIHADLSS